MSTPDYHSSTLSSPGGSIETNPSSANRNPASNHRDYALAAILSLTVDPKNHEGDQQIGVPSTQSFQCLHCSQSRTTKSLLNRHIKSHTRPHTCAFPGCRVSKAEQRDLDRHQDTHGKIRLYFCPVARCSYDANGTERGFSRRLDNAKRHLKSHDNHQNMSVLKEDSQGRLSRV